jgi:hypothetical protein
MTVYGDVPGAHSGQAVVAFIDGAAGTSTCGGGTVVDSSGPKYVVSVVHESARAGCGSTGKTVGFYVAPETPVEGGHLATTTTTWDVGGKQVSLSLGSQLTIRARVTIVASDRSRE